MLQGVEELADAVGVTLGPAGRNVILDRAWHPPVVTKDGFAVAHELEPENPFERLGVNLVRESSSRAYEAVGDGSTTSTVIAHRLLAEGFRLVAAGFDPTSLRRGMERAIAVVVDELARIARPVEGATGIGRVATIAAHGDREVGDLVARALTRIGKEGIISVEDGFGYETTLEFVEGMELDCGYLSPEFVTDPERMEACFEHCLVLIHDRRIHSFREILPILEICHGARKPLLVVAEKIEGEALQALLTNKARGALPCVAVQSPAYTDRRRTLLDDLAAVTGARVISDDLGATLERVRPEDLGTAAQVVVTREATTIVGGGGSKETIDALASKIRREIHEATSDLERERLESRLAALLGGIAIVRVGAATEVDLKEKKARIEGAVAAARAAMEEGVLPGGGASLIRAARALDRLELAPDEQPAVTAVRRALEEPARRLAVGAGRLPAVVVERIRAHDEGAAFGFDAVADEFGDLAAAGVLDSAKVLRTAVRSAGSVAGLLLASEVAIVEIPGLGEKDHLDPPKDSSGLRPRSGHLK